MWARPGVWRSGCASLSQYGDCGAAGIWFRVDTQVSTETTEISFGNEKRTEKLGNLPLVGHRTFASPLVIERAACIVGHFALCKASFAARKPTLAVPAPCREVFTRFQIVRYMGKGALTNTKQRLGGNLAQAVLSKVVIL